VGEDEEGTHLITAVDIPCRRRRGTTELRQFSRGLTRWRRSPAKAWRSVEKERPMTAQRGGGRGALRIACSLARRGWFPSLRRRGSQPSQIHVKTGHRFSRIEASIQMAHKTNPRKQSLWTYNPRKRPGTRLRLELSNRALVRKDHPRSSKI
jgi:hypothetical protein